MRAAAWSAALLIILAGWARAEEPGVVSGLKITTLSTMLTEFQGIGEWGYAALVEADGHALLFDTGERSDTVLKNAAEMGIDLSTVETVLLSHNHFDHTGGLTTLRREMKEKNPAALSTTHVGEGIFLPRVQDSDAVAKKMSIPRELLVSAVDVRDRYEELGGQFVIHAEPTELFPGVWITGPIPRIHPEKNWTPLSTIETPEGLIEDDIPEDQALVVVTSKGLVVVAGCGHAGIVNTLEYARDLTGVDHVHAIIGGLHLLSATDEQLNWTGEKLGEFGIEQMIGAHCTGIHAVHHLRESMGLDRRTATVGSVGSSFALEEGINTGLLTR